MHDIMKRTILAICILTTCLYQASFSQPVLTFQSVITGLNNPVDMADPGDGRLYIVQQGGLIRMWNGSSLSTFLDVSGLITSPAGNEQGLLSIAFHPDYLSNRYFFIWYTGTGGLLTLARYRRDALNPDLADPSTAQILFTQAKPGTPAYTNHNGAKLNFGPDGYLYIGTGDGGSGGDPFNNAQNGASYLGKLLRIDVNSFATSAPFYDIPPTNPFLSVGDGILDEIYAIGLRNPWRWSFDRNTGDLWIADVGQNAWEEVNYLPAGSTAGANYGWDCYEGAVVYPASSCTPPGTVVPVFTYPHNSTTGGYSITGGYVYRGTEYPGLQGYYITADYVSGNLWTIKPDGGGGWQVNMQTGLPNNISSFSERPDGSLYALKRNTGVVYKVVLSSVVPVTLTRFNGRSMPGYNMLEWTSAQESTGSTFELAYSRDGRHFENIGTLAGKNINGASYRFRHDITENGTSFYRLGMKEPDGYVRYSSLVKLNNTHGTGFGVYPNIISDRQFSISLNGQISLLQLFNTSGALVWQKQVAGMSGRINCGIPGLPPGTYLLCISGPNTSQREKIIIP